MLASLTTVDNIEEFVLSPTQVTIVQKHHSLRLRERFTSGTGTDHVHISTRRQINSHKIRQEPKFKS
eukprot:g34101.t1